jgi:hypothetical protein
LAVFLVPALFLLLGFAEGDMSRMKEEEVFSRAQRRKSARGRVLRGRRRGGFCIANRIDRKDQISFYPEIRIYE